jgi:Serine/threonine protein phosphatase
MTEPLTWRVLGASVPGTVHIDRGIPCQDASDWYVDEHLACIAVADGAGSRRRSERGSTVAVHAATMLARRLFDPAAQEDHEALIRHLVDGVRNNLIEVAMADDADLSEYDTTLAVAVLTGDRLVVAQIGDTIAVVIDGNGCRTLSPPPKFEYANETTFVTRESYERDIRVSVLPADDISLVVLSTDGMRYKLLKDLATYEPYEPFFVDVLSYARNPKIESESIEQFLRTINDQSGDDKSLAIAARLITPGN